jgi:hypothetical protein
MLGIYYTNAWGSRSLPFMSTQLLSEDGSKYPISKVFVGGVLNQDALASYGIPSLSGSFAYAMFIANAAVSIKPRTYQSFFWPRTESLPDWRTGCPLHPLLGWGHQKSVQERKRGEL